jgi:uncharacterized membrane protein YkvA (DUF1232 family)
VDTSQIEALIARQCDEPHCRSELHDLLCVVAERHGSSAQEDALDNGIRFVLAYIRQVPYMMKVASTAAGNVGLEDEMTQILEMVQSYWLESDDVIPDEMGVIGLLDDAYCSLSSLQAVSDHYQLQSGKYLFPDNLSPANRVMRKIIGEPYATDLDRIVITTLQDTGLIETIKLFASEEKQLDFSRHSTIWNHGPAGNMELENLADLGLLDD